MLKEYTLADLVFRDTRTNLIVHFMAAHDRVDAQKAIERLISKFEENNVEPQLHPRSQKMLADNLA